MSSLKSESTLSEKLKNFFTPKVYRNIFLGCEGKALKGKNPKGADNMK
jgi:hypothetical protein